MLEAACSRAMIWAELPGWTDLAFPSHCCPFGMGTVVTPEGISLVEISWKELDYVSE